jgi:hypothetical protein
MILEKIDFANPAMRDSIGVNPLPALPPCTITSMEWNPHGSEKAEYTLTDLYFADANATWHISPLGMLEEADAHSFPFQDPGMQ